MPLLSVTGLIPPRDFSGGREEPYPVTYSFPEALPLTHKATHNRCWCTSSTKQALTNPQTHRRGASHTGAGQFPPKALLALFPGNPLSQLTKTSLTTASESALPPIPASKKSATLELPEPNQCIFGLLYYESVERSEFPLIWIKGSSPLCNELSCKCGFSPWFSIRICYLVAFIPQHPE